MPRRKNQQNKKQLAENIIVNSDNVTTYIHRKIDSLRNIIQRTIISSHHYKIVNVINSNEHKICLESLHKAFVLLDSLTTALEGQYNQTEVVDGLQRITNDISTIFRSYGTQSLEDLLIICVGAEYVDMLSSSCEALHADKISLLLKYAHPISYRIFPWKAEHKDGEHKEEHTYEPIKKNKIVEDFTIVEYACNGECFDLSRLTKSFHNKVYGIKIAFRDNNNKKTMIVSALVDDVMLECAGSLYINKRIIGLRDAYKSNEEKDLFLRFIKFLTIKDLLVYSDEELLHRFIGYQNQIILIKQKAISQITKEFLGVDLYQQRSILMQLLLKANEHEYQYLAYLLYDLLSTDSNGSVDTHEQTTLFDSLPWNVKKHFRDAMKQTIQYTNNLSNLDKNKIPLEQQICLMNVDDSVKEKAMIKLKEVKAKSEDSGSKARQYLDGLLKIPFGIYRNEPILSVMNEATNSFNALINKMIECSMPPKDFPIKKNYTGLEMRKYCDMIEKNYITNAQKKFATGIADKLANNRRNVVISNIRSLNDYIKLSSLNYPKLLHSGKKNQYMRSAIHNFTTAYQTRPAILKAAAEYCGVKDSGGDIIPIVDSTLTNIKHSSEKITTYMQCVSETLDNAVHGHVRAKRQVERIIGQWMNGERGGYCFGFEGPPGVGKTSLAKKGIAHCLKNNNGESRPFAFIAIGGSSNGSTLDGHNYTYVGSTWGRIVDILMETKCMNPIIFIDELDKVSRTEHGREIIGILTHLIDPTQNDTFQDKYFTGIDINLSNALFIFSYNDVDAIDRVLLDRIHRIKFDVLSMQDKLTITHNYLFPEIFSKMGLIDVITISDDVVEFIIQQYTCEPGVRKLKELLFEIVGEINLSVLKKDGDYPLPINVTKEDIQLLYLKDRNEVRPKEIHKNSQIGLISGLWANSLGQGGVLPIEVSYYPCSSFFDLKLTGMQGDVMKESMNMAKTLAWKLACEHNKENTDSWVKSVETTKLQGIHIHVPEGATPKDGPSAGTAITVAMYSLFTQKRISNTVAITGEMSLQGRVTAIGGLDLKILGGIRAGVKTFIFPSENSKDFNKFIEKYKDKSYLAGIQFKQVDTIYEVFDIVFDTNN